MFALDKGSRHLIYKLEMGRNMFTYTKKVLESVSFDPVLFCKELEKALNALLPYELEELKAWLLVFIEGKPELSNCLQLIDID